MTDSDNRKEFRRNKLKFNNQKFKPELSEEQKFLNKSKKKLKKHIEDIRSDEAWEEWEDNK